MAYEIGERRDNELVLRTFSKAFAKQKDVIGLVVHSDRDVSNTEKYIRFYNQKRPQRKLKKLTSVEYRRQFAA
ncbi:IS3 family transposase [Paenibacillus silvae]|uniref:IS3 family transposase n=1 Tax=Paenibacillus silvae TaxID=1325358 RepID=UPI0030B8027C